MNINFRQKDISQRRSTKNLHIISPKNGRTPPRSQKMTPPLFFSPFVQRLRCPRAYMNTKSSERVDKETLHRLSNEKRAAQWISAAPLQMHDARNWVKWLAEKKERIEWRRGWKSGASVDVYCVRKRRASVPLKHPRRLYFFSLARVAELQQVTARAREKARSRWQCAARFAGGWERVLQRSFLPRLHYRLMSFMVKHLVMQRGANFLYRYFSHPSYG